MTWLRHASRHVHHTVANYVRHHLEQLDWMDPANTPFGAPPVTFTTEQVLFGDKRDHDIKAGTVSCTLGPEPDARDQELGGPLVAQDYTLFFDVFSGQEDIALALANDIRDILKGRLPDTRRFLDLVDQATGQQVIGWKMEFEDVERDRPDNQPALRWQVVKATAVTYFPEVTY